jgi:hypothetical protein
VVPPAARAFPWYLAGVSSWFAISGMQTIVFPWLVTVVLHEPAARVGSAGAIGAPALLLLQAAVLAFGGIATGCGPPPSRRSWSPC